MPIERYIPTALPPRQRHHEHVLETAVLCIHSLLFSACKHLWAWGPSGHEALLSDPNNSALARHLVGARPRRVAQRAEDWHATSTRDPRPSKYDPETSSAVLLRPYESDLKVVARSVVVVGSD